jgi:cytochrome c553
LHAIGSKLHSATLVAALIISTGLLSAPRANAQAGRAVPAPTAEQITFFENKVRPLLLASCTVCHSEASKQGGLRLDMPVTPEIAKEILVRVKGEGGKQRMPVGGELSKDKIAALEQWISTGAIWPAGKSKPVATLADLGKKHWSFNKLTHPAVPNVAGAANPIDAFIRSGLSKAGLKPTPTASRRELIRRLYYDLTGLPPTPEQVRAFVASKDPKAYDKLVDSLLASPHYGEKWARHWLDLVRYAETNSYERDNPKPYTYRYRDYVIRAFNEDKPYNRFVKEQIAGDEMADPAHTPAVGTGFYRLGLWDDEPADRLQAEYDDLDDIVATTGQAFLGLTLDCARCHDHKLDPIPQRDYYRMLAVFRPLNRYRNGGDSDETVWFQDDAAKRDYDAKMTALKESRKTFASKISEFEKLLQSKGTRYYNPADVTDLSYRLYERDWRRIPEFENEPSISGGNMPPGLISISPRQRNEEFSIEFNAQLNVPVDGDYTFHFKSQGGYRFSVDGTLFEAYATKDGKPTENSAKRHLSKGKHGINLIYVQRQHMHGLAISWSGPGFEQRPLSALDSCGVGELPTLFGPNLASVIGKDKAEEFENVVNAQAALEEQAPPTDKVITVTENTGAKPTHILLRGVPTAEGDVVEPGVPSCVAPDPLLKFSAPPGTKSTGRRTALANWIASEDNPLTARVMVNRIWQYHFGRGIVKTANDFGLQGAKPTQPQLLDWLAGKFMKDGWSIKKLSRLILTSETYKQSSAGNPAGLKKDPQNDLYWRFDMRRLTAEEIRDSVLAVSGALNLKMFGPGVYPEIPKEILAAQSRPGKDWYTERMTPEDMNRRSIYIFAKRSLTYPMLSAFDIPDGDRSAPIRFASTQPTQALGQMNGPFANAQADVMAARVRKEVGNAPAAFARRILELTQQRDATQKDIQECVALYEKLKKRGATPEIAQKYLCLMAINLDEFFYLD